MSIETKIEKIMEDNLGYILGIVINSIGVVSIASVGYRIGFEDMNLDTAWPLIKGYSIPMIFGTSFILMNYLENKKVNDSTSQ
ncbi:hypothetical protein J4223_00085 [Candidatus Woesearchaeota archaeon]|nr:hypothetical protein [Candidatus Woesearchaeota archaeon]